IVSEYDNLSLSCLFHQASGYLLPPAMVERRYGIIENQSRFMRRRSQFSKESRQSHASLFAFAENVLYLRVRLREQSHLILRRAILTTGAHDLDTYFIGGQLYNFLLKTIPQPRRNGRVRDLVSQSRYGVRCRVLKTLPEEVNCS